MIGKAEHSILAKREGDSYSFERALSTTFRESGGRRSCLSEDSVKDAVTCINETVFV